METTATKKTSTPKTTTSDRCRQLSALKQQTGVFKAAAAAANDPFNTDDVVENPSVAISRVLAKGDCIDATIYAQQVHGKWIASVEWSLAVAPFDGRSKLPCRKSVATPGCVSGAAASTGKIRAFFPYFQGDIHGKQQNHQVRCHQVR